MKAFIKLSILILILSILVTGCRNEPEDIIDRGEESKEEIVAVPEVELAEVTVNPIRKVRPKIVDPFLEKFSPKVTAQDLNLYIQDNISNASKEEADNMIQWLLIYQEETSRWFDSKLEEKEYRVIVSDDMEGVLDKAKVYSIQDDNIRKDFITLVNSCLTISSYEENLVIETEWRDLILYAPYLSDDFSEIIRLSKKLNHYEYDYGELGVESLSSDIIILEEIAKNSKSAFIKWKANDLCRSLISTLFFEEEGNYLFGYDGKGSKEYAAIMSIRDKYPKSILKEIIEDIDLIDEEDTWVATKIIDKKFEFGLSSDNYLEINNIKEKNGEYELIEIHIPSNPEKQNLINSIIKLDTEELIVNLAKDKTFTFNSYIDFTNNRYISYSCYINITDSNGNENSIYLDKTLDYKEGKYITLEDYFDSDFIFIQEFVENLSGIKIDTLPKFQLSKVGINLYLNEEEDYLFVNRIDLLEYFTLEELIGID